MQGTYPVINLTFADFEEGDYNTAINGINRIMQNLYRKYRFILDSDCFDADEKDFFRKMGMNIPECQLVASLQTLSEFLYRYYGKKVV